MKKHQHQSKSTLFLLSPYHTPGPLLHPPFPTSTVASVIAGIGEELISGCIKQEKDRSNYFEIKVKNRAIQPPDADPDVIITRCSGLIY